MRHPCTAADHVVSAATPARDWAARLSVSVLRAASRASVPAACRRPGTMEPTASMSVATVLCFCELGRCGCTGSRCCQHSDGLPTGSLATGESPVVCSRDNRMEAECAVFSAVQPGSANRLTAGHHGQSTGRHRAAGLRVVMTSDCVSAWRRQGEVGVVPRRRPTTLLCSRAAHVHPSCVASADMLRRRLSGE